MQAIRFSLIVLTAHLAGVFSALHYGNSSVSASTSTLTLTEHETETEYSTSSESLISTSTSTLTLTKPYSSSLTSSATSTSYSTETSAEVLGYYSNIGGPLSSTQVGNSVSYDYSDYYNAYTESFIPTATVTPTVYFYFTTVTSQAASYTYTRDSASPTTLAPYVLATSWTWSQLYTPVNLGKVYIIINNLNQTITSTSTNSAALAGSTQWLNNGTLQLLTRTDVNDAGTVTATVASGLNGTYPTHYFTVPGPIFWEGTAPVTQMGGVCCNDLTVSSAVPQNHYPFPSSTGTADPNDPRGWLYVIDKTSILYSGTKNVSSLLAPATINSVLNYCSVEYPPGYSASCVWTTAAAEVSAVNEAGELLTTTVHITASSSASAATPTAAAEKASAQVSPPTSASAAVTPPATTAPTSTIAATQQTPTSASAETLASSSERSSASPPNSNAGSTEGAASGLPSTETGQPSSASPVESSAAVTDVPVSSESQQGSSTNNAGGAVASLFGFHTTLTSTSIAPGSSPSTASTVIAQQSTLSHPIAQLTSSTEPSVSSGNSADPHVSNGYTGVAVLPAQISTSESGSATAVPGIIVGSQTVPLGTTASIDGTLYAVVMSGTQTYAVVNGATSPLSGPTGTPVPIVMGSNTVSANGASQYVVSGQTLAAGGTVTVGTGSSAAVIVLQTSGSQTYAVVNGATTPLSESTADPVPGIVVGSNTVSANAASQYIVSGQTLAAGGTITMGTGSSATVVALQTSGSQTLLVVGSMTSTLSASATQQPTLQPITVASAVLTPVSASEYIVGSQTLTPGGPAITVGGTRYSLASGATELVYGSSTTKISVSAAGLGSYIWAGMGSSASETETSKESSTSPQGAPSTSSIDTTTPGAASATNGSSGTGTSGAAYRQTGRVVMATLVCIVLVLV